MNTLCLVGDWWGQATTRLTKRFVAILMLLLLFWVVASPAIVSAYAGLGGYISEKLLGDGTASSLYLGDSAAGPVVLGSAPIISTMAATDAIFPDSGPTTATLWGNISDLNGMPSAEYWFVWGYTPATMVNTTAVGNTAVIGNQSVTITDYDPGLTVYYQFQSGTDGRAYGGISSFTAGGGRGTAYWLLRNILTLVMALAILVVAIQVAKTGNWVAALTLIIIGMIGIAVVIGMLGTMWP